MCKDFDLCIECFSVGAELTPHKSNHPYRVMENLSFPLLCPDWNLEDEILLIEGIELHGLGKWTEVAEHVGTKNKESCLEHYNNVYLNSPIFPLPDMSHIAGKNREELLAMAKWQGKDKKDTQVECNFGGKKPSSPENEGASLVESSGYNPKRQEFNPEYDNDAEQLLAEMEFDDADTEEERELKLRVLRIYSKRLDERKCRKDFILERNLSNPKPFEEDLTPEEKTVCQKYDVFMRFHTKEEHKELLRIIILEHRTRKRLQELQEARTAGCLNSAEADIYLAHKRREAEESAPSAEKMDVASYCEADLLSEPEKRLCCELRLLPAIYLKMQEQLSLQILSGIVSSKSDAHQLFQMDPMKIDRVYDMLIKKGIGSA
ncbi:PREDICTED: transcriptional adapter ADA2b-like [Lupinus angustifolius]|nr:PREDICTED: transcriptional adapter ADA2b-like [Lupinus angustifolius]